MAFLFKVNGVSLSKSIWKTPKITHLCPSLLISKLLHIFGPQKGKMTISQFLAWNASGQCEQENRPPLEFNFRWGLFSGPK